MTEQRREMEETDGINGQKGKREERVRRGRWEIKERKNASLDSRGEERKRERSENHWLATQARRSTKRKRGAAVAANNDKNNTSGEREAPLTSTSFIT